MSEPVVRLRVNGREVESHPAWTVGAVLARSVGLGWKESVSGEPRGALCGMGICAECAVTVDGLAHVRACVTIVREGMRVETSAGPT